MVGEGIKDIYRRFINKLAFIAPGGERIRPWLQRLRGVQIGKNVWISQYVHFDELYPEKIKIGDNCTIGLRVSIFSHMHWYGKSASRYSAPVTIGNDVFIGPHCVILPNVSIGDGAVIKAGTVVTRNVPAYTFWGSDSAGPLGAVTVPLTNEYTFIEFRNGLRPIRKRNGSTQLPLSS
jgi:acetyltransferase-like isoleucine patch superfamily enzyme